LKNSISQMWAKKLCARKPYKRLSRFFKTFSIPQISTASEKMEFFNSHGILRQQPDSFRFADNPEFGWIAQHDRARSPTNRGV